MNDRHAAANLEQIRLLLEGLQSAQPAAPPAGPENDGPLPAGAASPDTGVTVGGAAGVTGDREEQTG